MILSYTTNRDTDGEREVMERLSTFVDRSGTLGDLVDLLVTKGLLDLQDVFEKFKTWEDRNRIEGGEPATSSLSDLQSRMNDIEKLLEQQRERLLERNTR